MTNPLEAQYLRTVAELQELATRAPYVDQDWVLTVASMDAADMRRRLIRSKDWHGHFSHCLDGIDAIKALPGAGIDGCRSHKEVRAVVMGLLAKIDRMEASPTPAAAPVVQPAVPAPHVGDVGGEVEAVRYADQIETEVMEILNGTRKPGRLSVEPIVKLCAYVRTGSTSNATLASDTTERAIDAARAAQQGAEK